MTDASKPDVVAPGTNILSARSTSRLSNPLWGDVRDEDDPLYGRYCWSGGTSMKYTFGRRRRCLNPATFGASNVVTISHLVKPSGALLKAIPDQWGAVAAWTR